MNLGKNDKNNRLGTVADVANEVSVSLNRLSLMKRLVLKKKKSQRHPRVTEDERTAVTNLSSTGSSEIRNYVIFLKLGIGIGLEK